MRFTRWRRRLCAHLAANETAHVTSRNLSSMGRADAKKVQATVERALRKRVRNPTAVDVALTISENVQGYLLVAQIQTGRGDGAVSG